MSVETRGQPDVVLLAAPKVSFIFKMYFSNYVHQQYSQQHGRNPGRLPGSPGPPAASRPLGPPPVPRLLAVHHESAADADFLPPHTPAPPPYSSLGEDPPPGGVPEESPPSYDSLYPGKGAGPPLGPISPV